MPDYILESPPLSPDAQEIYEHNTVPMPGELFIDSEIFCIGAWKLAVGFMRTQAESHRKTTWTKAELADLVRGMHNVYIYNEELRNAPLVER